MREKMVHPDRPKMTICHMRFSCWITKATHTQNLSLSVSLRMCNIAFPWRQCLKNAPKCYDIRALPVLLKLTIPLHIPQICVNLSQCLLALAGTCEMYQWKVSTSRHWNLTKMDASEQQNWLSWIWDPDKAVQPVAAYGSRLVSRLVQHYHKKKVIHINCHYLADWSTLLLMFLQCLKWSVTNLSPWRRRSNFTPVQIRFVTNEVALEQFFSQYFAFPLPVPFH
jgi:hypothetical protein